MPLIDSAKPLVYTALGTVNAEAGERFLTACAQALGDRPSLQAVLADPRGLIRHPPANVRTLAYAPQREIIAAAGAVICHGGHNTVCEALACGVPLVVAPIRDDQPIVAEQVVRAGAGVRVRFDRAGASQIGEALDTVLNDPRYRVGAARIRDSFRAAGGSQAAADHLAALVRTYVG
jgi:MGT family glycosyltransferase